MVQEGLKALLEVGVGGLVGPGLVNDQESDANAGEVVEPALGRSEPAFGGDQIHQILRDIFLVDDLVALYLRSHSLPSCVKKSSGTLINPSRNLRSTIFERS